jgi:hypothetical protein
MIMKSLSSLVLAMVISSMIISGAQAEMAKEGSGNYRSGRSATIDIMKMGNERLQINYDETGVVVESPDNSPFYNASFRTMGTIHVTNGILNYNGAALWTRPNGDQIFGIFKGEGERGGATSGILEIVGGTGECTGINGTLKLKSGAPVKSSKEGTSQGTTEGAISWKIP